MALLARVSRQGGLEPFETMNREFDGALGRLFGVRNNEDGGAIAPYAVDVREDADHLYVEAELPGFKKEDLDITLENQTLTISANRTESAEAPVKGDWLVRERRYSRFLRAFTLPTDVNEQKVDAKLSEGILTITLDKREEAKPRKIQVS